MPPLIGLCVLLALVPVGAAGAGRALLSARSRSFGHDDARKEVSQRLAELGAFFRSLNGDDPAEPVDPTDVAELFSRLPLPGKNHQLAALEEKGGPFREMFYDQDNEKVCTHLCHFSCTYDGGYNGPGFPNCVNCETSCYSFQECGKDQSCLENTACSVLAFKKAVEKGAPPKATIPAWHYCKEENFAQDANCQRCKSCIDNNCRFSPAAGNFASCAGPWGECCHQKCLGKGGRPTHTAMSTR